MDICHRDEPTAENLVSKKALPIPEKNWKTCWGGGGGWHPPHLAIGWLKLTVKQINKRRKLLDGWLLWIY